LPADFRKTDHTARATAIRSTLIAFDAGNCPSGDFTDSNRHMIAVQANFTPPDGSGDLALSMKCGPGGRLLP
jgi:hypothetical protein